MNTTGSTQVWPGRRDMPTQTPVPDKIPKSAAFVPVMAAVMTPVGDELWFCSVITR